MLVSWYGTKALARRLARTGVRMTSMYLNVRLQREGEARRERREGRGERGGGRGEEGGGLRT